MAHMPKYEKIKQQLLGELRSGVYPTGSRLPTREELLSRYGVTRTTINQALRELVDQGVLQTSKRGGTVYTGKEPPCDVAVIASGFSARFDANGALGESLEAMVLWQLLMHSGEFNIHLMNLGNLNFDRLDFIMDYHAAVFIMPPDELLSKLRKYGDKVLLLNRYGENFNYISTPHREAVRKMVLHNIDLARTHGAMDLYMLEPAQMSFVLRERCGGVLDGAAERGVAVQSIRFANNDFDDMLATLRGVTLRRGVKHVLVSPQIACTGAVIQLAKERNLIFGRDLFYSDFDNPYVRRNTGEPIVSADQDYRKMGDIFCDALRKMGRGPLVQEFVEPALVL